MVTADVTLDDAEPALAAPGGPARPAPMLPATMGLIGGITLDAFVAVPSMWHYVLFAGAALQLGLAWRSPGPRRAALLLAGFACGLALHHAAFRRVEVDHLAALELDRPALVRLRGNVVAAPAVTKPPPGAFYSWSSGHYLTRLLLDCREVEVSGSWRPLSGLLPVCINSPAAEVGLGDRLEIFGRLSPIRPVANPGQKNWDLFNRRRGIYARLSCSHPQAVRVIESGGRSGAVYALRSAARRLLLPEMHSIDDEASSLAESVVLGQRSRVSPTLNQAFARTGTSHYLSASGLHVGMLAGFVWFVAAAFGVRRRPRACLVLVIVVLYAVVAEPRAPILRAATITVLFCISVVIQRDVHKLNWIATAALVILVARPCDLFSAGFQLSFVVVLGIIYLTPHLVGVMRGLWPTRYRLLERLREREHPPPQWRLWCGALGNALLYAVAVALAAWCSGLLLVAWHFQQLAPWGWLNSLLLMPPAFAVMICGFGRVMVGLVWPLAGAWMGPALDAFTRAMAGAVYWLADWPAAALSVPRPAPWLLLFVYGAMVCLVRARRCDPELAPHRVRLWRLNVALVLGIALLLLLWPLPAPPDGLVIDVLAVGDGSATVFRLPDNRTLIYDCGSLSMSDAGRSVTVPALMSHHVNTLDAAIVSHLNTDHYNGLPTVLAAVPTARVLLSTYSRKPATPHSSASRLMDILEERRITLETLVAGRLVSFGRDVTCEVLWPPDAGDGLDLSVNDSSLVLRFEHSGRSVLFCGDIETFVERRLMDHPHLPSDVLILPHHGSVVASTAEFIRAVSPSIVIRSSGRTAERTHSSLRVLVAGTRYYNTADHGALRIRLAAGEVSAAPIMDSYSSVGRSPAVE